MKRENDPADKTLAAMKAPKEDAPAPVASAASQAPAGIGEVRVPDATGLGAHDAVLVLTRAGLVPRLEGMGRAVRMSPAAGSAVPKGSSVRLVLEPPS